ncbi:glutamate/tyrosine decarboxylase-like PLP-dependent enzyme [Allocatelliglobosispora scoriae]|uniref:Glutamate/tyrosine decarboxylase-like PLP-dependent enzyme n=1 Tax=Allocatelliglobosispora scoriae TaxID=643052 RepID=A0A841BJJ4_9ACTN|nr:pyridoxal-dependent decarboxylase [Allocatelliglobosispora scoriae]MBB5867071.1 glutamate/tyrosine decarboxylase-like PLP-dependent enzyme [Allocatelliglobosispora scoriae]
MDDLRRAGRTAADLVADHLGGLTGRPVWQPVGDADRAWLTGQPLPAAGRPLGDLLDDVRDRIMPHPMGNGHPRFFGWVNSAPSPAAIAVSSLGAALNPSCAGGDHAGALLERSVVRWLAELVGFPHRPGGGLLTSGASMATIIALASARQRAARADGWDVRTDGLAGHRPLVMYASAEGHGCLRKAAELLGIGSRHLRTVPVDGAFRLDADALRAMIVDDAAAGLRPFCVAASAGTVNTGTIDPLDAIADIAAEHGLWFHVDGAYGALGILDERIRPAFAGWERADSVVLDPHKWLGVPVDCGCVLLRDPAAARDAFSLVPAYLRDDTAGDLGWFAEYGPEQTRPFRALRVWATISHLGRDGIVDLVERTAALAHELAAMIEAADDFELLTPVSTSITAFRYRPTALAAAALDDLNRAVPAAVQRRGRAFLTGTRLGGVEALRACFLNPATTHDDLAVLLDEIRAAA